MSLDAFSIATEGVGNNPLVMASLGYISSSEELVIFDEAQLYLRAKARGSSSKKHERDQQHYKTFEIFAEIISVKSPFIINASKISGKQEQKIQLPIRQLVMKIENITPELPDLNDIVIQRAELNYEHRKR